MRTSTVKESKEMIYPAQMTPAQRNELTKQWMPLIHKISKQNAEKSGVEYDTVLSFAFDGFIEAMEKYNPERSTMRFDQFAAYRMAQSCLNGINEFGHTIKVSKYMREKMSNGETEAVTTSSLDFSFDGEDCYTDHCIAIAVEDNVNAEDEYSSTFRNLFAELEKKFPARNVEILYSKFGLNGRPEMTCKELSAKFGITGPRISKILGGIYEYIATKPELAEELKELMANY